MTPKEKAEELVRSFMIMKPTKLSDYSKIYLPTAKECALRVVNEIYKLRLTHGQHLNYDLDKINYYSYWEEVKQEIEKL